MKFGLRILSLAVLLTLSIYLNSCGTTNQAGGGGISGSSLQSISVTPGNSSIAAGTSKQFKATGIYSDNTTQDLTTQVVWSSSSATVATISNVQASQGLVSSLTVGTTTIQPVHQVSQEPPF